MWCNFWCLFPSQQQLHCCKHGFCSDPFWMYTLKVFPWYDLLFQGFLLSWFIGGASVSNSFRFEHDLVTVISDLSCSCMMDIRWCLIWSLQQHFQQLHQANLTRRKPKLNVQLRGEKSRKKRCETPQLKMSFNFLCHRYALAKNHKWSNLQNSWGQATLGFTTKCSWSTSVIFQVLQTNKNWLVVEPTHLKNMSQIGSFPPK